MSHFEKLNRDMIDFLIENMPHLDDIFSPAIIQNLIYLFEEVTLEYDNVVVEEGDSGKYFYMLYEGSCDMYKKWVYETKPKHKFESPYLNKFYGLEKSKCQNLRILSTTKG